MRETVRMPTSSPASLHVSRSSSPRRCVSREDTIWERQKQAEKDALNVEIEALRAAAGGAERGGGSVHRSK